MRNKTQFLLFSNSTVFSSQKYIFKIIYLIYCFFISGIAYSLLCTYLPHKNIIRKIKNAIRKYAEKGAVK